MKKENIKKKHDHYLHTVNVIYPIENVKNMVNNWKDTVSKQEEWISKYDDYLKEAEEIAEKSVEMSIAEAEKEVMKVLAMSDQERFEYWNKQFLEDVDALNKLKEDKETLIKKQFEENKKLLLQYKMSYEQDMKNKKEAIKRWTI